MIDFQSAFKRTMDFEGRVLVNDPNDPGGQTFWGISRKNWPSWPGWVVIDSDGANDPSLPALVSAFYLVNFWQKAGCDNYPGQELANQVFDAYVNLGVRVLEWLQQLINQDGHADLGVDGIIGQKTLAALNSMCQESGTYANLVVDFMDKRATYYKDLAQEKPDMAEYLNGWLKRCQRSLA